MALPTDSAARKSMPIARGVLFYFPDALAAVAQVSKAGNDKHNPGEPLHWSKEKSNDHADCVARHLLEAGTIDHDDGLRHSAKLAWRALALLQTELEAAREPVELPGHFGTCPGCKDAQRANDAKASVCGCGDPTGKGKLGWQPQYPHVAAARRCWSCGVQEGCIHRDDCKFVGHTKACAFLYGLKGCTCR